MKLFKLLIGCLMIGFVFMATNSTNAQLCSPNPMYTGNGIYPDTATDMQTGCLGSFYQETFTINVPPDTTVFGQTFTIVYMQVDSVGGLPPGITYGCNPINCYYPGNSSGCFQVYGTPMATGSFDLTFYVHGMATHPFIPPQTVSFAYTGYELNVGVHPTLTTGNTTATCDSNNATAWVIPSGSSGYTYNWNTVPASNNDSIFNQYAGIYMVTVNDLFNCAATDTVFINNAGAPQIDSIITTQTSCYGDSTGSATALISGGTVPYSFAWGNGDTTATMTGVSEGIYPLQVTDLNGCIANDVAVITEPPQLFAFASHVDALCFGDNSGLASAAVLGGTGSYDYLWSNGDINLTANSLSAGTYTITVTDDNGCTITSSTTVGQPSAITTNTVGFDASCFGGSDGSANVGVGGGTPGYTYAWSNFANTPSVSGLFAGMYYVTVTDTNGCTVTDSVLIHEPSMITVSFTTTPESMLTMLDGSIDATPGGGIPGYTYVWSNGATTQDISGLAGGTYTLTITDANGCSSIDTITVQTLPGFGLEEENERLGLYPNPASGYFFVEMNAPGTLALFDLTGKQVLSKNVLKGKQMIDLPELNKGVYMLSVWIGNQPRVTRLMVE